MKRNFKHIRFFALFLTVLIAACSAPQLKNASNIEAEAQLQANAETNKKNALDEALRNLDKAINEDGLDLYSPLHMKSARKSVEDSKLYQNAPPKGLKNASLMSAIAASKYIEQAYKNQKLVKATIAEADKHLLFLKKLDAASLVPEDYLKATQHFKESAVLIENGNAKEASRNQNDLIDILVDVQIKALNQKWLGKSLERIAKIDEINGKKYIPAMYKSAKKSLQQTLAFISTNFRDQSEIEILAQKANTKIAKAFFISTEANNLSNLNDEELGSYLSGFFERLDKTYTQLANEEKELLDFKSLSIAILAGVEANAQQSSTDIMASNDLNKRNYSAKQNLRNEALAHSKLEEPKEETVLPGFDDSSFTVETEFNSDEESFDDEVSF